MGLKINLVNQRFGRLTVIQDSGKRTGSRHGDGHVIWGCRCDCGKWVNVISGNLRYGHTRSCGCLKEEQRRTQGKVNLRHGENDKNSRLYVAWVNIKRKGRRTRICKEWLDRKTGYISFRTWALNHGYSPGVRLFFIARKDLRKHYSPDNCYLTPKSKWMERRYYYPPIYLGNHQYCKRI